MYPNLPPSAENIAVRGTPDTCHPADSEAAADPADPDAAAFPKLLRLLIVAKYPFRPCTARQAAAPPKA